MNQTVEVLDQQIKEAKQANQSQVITNFDKLKSTTHFDDNTIQSVLKKGYTRS